MGVSNRPTLQRHYPIARLDFRDLWDICTHYQRVNPRYQYILYTVETLEGVLVEQEKDVATVLRAVSGLHTPIRRYVARFYEDLGQSRDSGFGSTKLMYLPMVDDFSEAGLYYFGRDDSKLSLYRFEDMLHTNYEIQLKDEAEIEFGVPCEVLALVIDLRGFSAFCEKPNIESPYTCGLLTGFYNMIRGSLIKFPPDMMKFLGDGVLAIWETTREDRDIALNVALDAVQYLPSRWKEVLRSPHFIHGAPEGLGCGLSFGLASKISVGNDYLGRPINIASRLCDVCPPNAVLIDRVVPGVKEKVRVQSKIAQIKSYGEYRVYMLT